MAAWGARATGARACASGAASSERPAAARSGPRRLQASACGRARAPSSRTAHPSPSAARAGFSAFAGFAAFSALGLRETESSFFQNGVFFSGASSGGSSAAETGGWTRTGAATGAGGSAGSASHWLGGLGLRPRRGGWLRQCRFGRCRKNLRGKAGHGLDRQLDNRVQGGRQLDGRQLDGRQLPGRLRDDGQRDGFRRLGQIGRGHRCDKRFCDLGRLRQGHALDGQRHRLDGLRRLRGEPLDLARAVLLLPERHLFLPERLLRSLRFLCSFRLLLGLRLLRFLRLARERDLLFEERLLGLLRSSNASGSSCAFPFFLNEISFFQIESLMLSSPPSARRVQVHGLRSEPSHRRRRIRRAREFPRAGRGDSSARAPLRA